MKVYAAFDGDSGPSPGTRTGLDRRDRANDGLSTAILGRA